MTERAIQISERNIKEFELFLYERENAEATIRKYKTDIQTFFRFLGEERVVNKLRILEYKEWLVSQYAVSSVNSILASLNQFLEFQEADFLKVKRLKVQKNLFMNQEKELTRQEYQRLLQTARDEGKVQLALCIETIAATGVRISELRYFTVERVRKGRIEIYNKGKYRRVFLAEDIRNKILLFCEEQKIQEGYVFATKSGKPKDRSNIWSEMKGLTEKAGVSKEKVYPHNLRHLFARVYYQYTKDLTGLADLLGHSSLNVTRIYTANTGEVYQQQLDQIMKLSI